ncbi:MAG: SDR family NAD(P)-dependent oxidoreductase [Verrucomicrobia bacterium]|nr:SDR family NAD(P)-dependent oxidoreductase [Verrucomicrobiota bacterium]
MQTSTVIVTGGTKGLGREISLAFARRGHHVLALYHRDEQSAAKLDADFAAEKLAGRAFRHDVADAGENAAVWTLPEIREASSLVLIHNACAAFEPKPLHLLAWEDFDTGLQVALKGGWLRARALLRPMLAAKRGHLVTVLSTALHGPPPKGFTAYAAAKAALRAFTQSLAVEYAPRGLKVFSVSPGFMETALTANWNAQLKSGIRAAASVTDPAHAAGRLLELVESAATRGQGEDYPL